MLACLRRTVRCDLTKQMPGANLGGDFKLANRFYSGVESLPVVVEGSCFVAGEVVEDSEIRLFHFVNLAESEQG